ncbi:bifunctional 4-hydroxy-2-oxoglutarate aldolase/2-dehydro-3-deoxy-phosphogluconate aldolase [Psittacicella hinzii]|uniref:2-dehydro-3-deoxy-phosphogluconate aldolase n=1 Tax=Psittacicella hinzii TaxID=2028575 RepID=A0A3A1YSF9_9GAMM|nr:bifunctional 4-hydroxy-2-oxoglutarate aldolase/2-dehydro-3-deoxy-phosphogluconate aldolase [Psittacicella hinzii]RIY40441.1 hypothetical protein CKF58_00635 [Psittacicella hinzii]
MVTKHLTYAQIEKVPLVAVITLKNIAQAVPLAEALKKGGLTNLEITLRTPIALDVIRLLRDEFPDLNIGAGTVTDPNLYRQAKAAGAQFMVSPGATPELLVEAAKYHEIPFYPGVCTPSEMLLAESYGFDHVKFFPAEALGGAKTLKAIAAALPNISILASGGITEGDLADYFNVSSVYAVSGSWFIAQDLMNAGRWDEVEILTRSAVIATKNARSKALKK